MLLKVIIGIIVQRKKVMRPGVQKERNVAISIGASVNSQNADTFILKNFAVFI